MPLWLIPMVYVAAAVLLGFLFPRFEYLQLSQYSESVSQLYVTSFAVASAQALLSAIASGMMAVTAIIFTVAYITAQFNSVAYSPRVALMFVRDPILYHSFGLFSSTFIFSLFTLAWVDREASEMVPIFSMAIVAILLVGSMFAFSRLVRGVNDLQVTNTLQTIGNHGRAVLSATFSHLGNAADSNAKDRPRIVTFCISPSPRSCDTPVRPDQSPSSMSTHWFK